MKDKIKQYKNTIKKELSKPLREKKPMTIMLLSLSFLFSIVIVAHLFKSYQMANYLRKQSEEAVTVSTTVVEYEEWSSVLKTFGTITAVLGIDITTEVPGIVEYIHFEDGQMVQKGDKILQLLADNDIALLKSLEAAAKAAEITYELDKKQYDINVVSKETLEMDYYNMLNQQGLVEQQAAFVEKKNIRAPFAGKVGIAQTNIGEYLNPGDPIVSLQNLTPLYLEFYLPEKYFSSLDVGQTIHFTTDAYPDRTFSAQLNAIEPNVDENSRNLQIEGVFENPDYELLPGMYVSIELVTGKPQQYLTVPQAAISYNPYGNLAYVVTKKIKINGKENKEDFNEGDNDQGEQGDLYAEQRFVTLGELRGDQVVVLSGLNEGDVIITSGQLKLKNHSRIIINNEVVPSNDANPDVKDEQTI